MPSAARSQQSEKTNKIHWKPVVFFALALIYPLVFQNNYFLDVFVASYFFRSLP